MRVSSLIILCFLVFGAVLTSCKQNETKSPMPNGFHKIIAKEVLQANSYTYVLADENGTANWLAFPKREIVIGKTYYHPTGMEMKNFKSKDLDRTFESVYFLASMLDELPGQNEPKLMGNKPVKPKITQQEIKVEKLADGISIGDLYSDPEKYDGKNIQIKGEVVKVNAQILGKKWVHLQDGTSGNGKFDLTFTTSNETIANVGDVIVFEGTVILNKDFGHGYKYDVLVENSKILKEL